MQIGVTAPNAFLCRISMLSAVRTKLNRELPQSFLDLRTSLILKHIVQGLLDR
jgi:hypothetical protein